jgi:chromatin remodeling complex protein RSC6
MCSMISKKKDLIDLIRRTFSWFLVPCCDALGTVLPPSGPVTLVLFRLVKPCVVHHVAKVSTHSNTIRDIHVSDVREMHLQLSCL